MTELSINDEKELTLDTKSVRNCIDVELAHPVKFKANEEVLSRWNDGLLYIGHVLQVDYYDENCLLKFDDSSEYWTKFKDIHRIKGPSDGSDIICSLCMSGVSEPPNEIVICDNCGVGYHQNCHLPSIPHSTLLPDVEWNCRLCVFGNTAKIGGALNKGRFAKAMQTMKQTLPYDMKLLTWDAQHKTNREQTYCYCGGPGDWCFKMLQCNNCKQWFHEACIQCLEKPLLFGDRFYIFICSVCAEGPEFIKRMELKWVDLIHLVLFNISLQDGRKYFDIEDCIVGFIQKNWEMLQLQGSVVSSRPGERVAIVKSTLESNRVRFKCGNEIRKRTSIWGLRSKVPPPAPRINYTIQELFAENLKKKLKLHSAFISLSSYASSKRIRQGGKLVVQPSNFGQRQNGNVPQAVRQLRCPLQEDATSETESPLFKKLRQRLKDALKHSKFRCSLVLPELTEDKKKAPKRSKKQEKETVVQKSAKPPKPLIADKSANHSKPRRKYVRRSPSSSASSNKTSRNCDTLGSVEDAPLRGNLDSIIPPPPDFHGRSNPFYDMTLASQNSHRPRKRHLSQEASNLANNTEGRHKRLCRGRVGNGTTSILAERIEVRTNRRFSNGFGRFSVDKCDSNAECGRSSRKKFIYANGAIVKEVKETPAAGANGCFKPVSGEDNKGTMKLLGTRITPGRKVQYLIEWN